jgi:anti-anti-sigma factor
MELRVLSDDEEVLRLEAIGAIVEVETMPDPDPIGRLLASRPHATAVVLGLARTRFIDSSGLAWLLTIHRRLCEGGGKLVLHSLPPNVEDILKMMRLDSVFNVADDESAALNSIRGEPQ